VGFVVDEVALGQVFSEYFGFPCKSSFHKFIHNHHHLSSGAGTIDQYWPQYQETQSHSTKNNKKIKKGVKELSASHQLSATSVVPVHQTP
jgi:hypothetical protein